MSTNQTIYWTDSDDLEHEMLVADVPALLATIAAGEWVLEPRTRQWRHASGMRVGLHFGDLTRRLGAWFAVPPYGYEMLTGYSAREALMMVRDELQAAVVAEAAFAEAEHRTP